MRTATMTLVLTCCVLAAESVAWAPAAVAQTSGRWTLEPSSIDGAAVDRTYFDYTLAPGSAIQDYVRLANGTDHDITFTLYSSDAYTTAQGAFALRLRNQPRTGVGAWVSLPFTSRTVAAGTVASFPFQLGVPADAAPGDSAGGIVAVASTPANNGPSNGLTIEQGNGVRVYVRVKGPVHPSLAVTRFDDTVSGGAWSPLAGKGHSSITYEVANDGNVRLAGTAELEIVDLFGHVVKTFAPRHLPELLPGDTNTVTETWDGLPLLHVRLRPRLVIRGPEVEVTRDAAAVWHVSIPVVVLATALLCLIALAMRWLVARVHHHELTRTPAAA